MRTSLDSEYLSVAQAAATLQVHTSSIRRWIAQGLLPAYRIGRRRMAIRRADVASLITPTRDTLTEGPALAPSATPQIGRLTSEQQQAGLAAIDALRRLQAEMAVKYGPRWTTPSWELLGAARAERDRQLE